MATSSAQQRLFEELLDRFGPEIAKAFLEAVDDLKTAAEIQRLTAAIETQDLMGALDALHLDEAAYGPLQDALQRTFAEGGKMGAGALPSRSPDGAALVVRFNARNLEAEAFLRNHSSQLVTRILEDQRTAVRTALEDGMRRGDNPRTVALDIVGRIDKTTGKREGGVLGLSAPQERAVANARDELTSNDPAALKNYLGRARRDKRFDRTIEKAIRDETPVPPETIGKALIAYERRLLKLRGDTIGRTEAMTALHAAQHEALKQAVASGQIAASAVRRTWQSAGDARVRHTHMALDGDTVGLEERFRSPSGARLLYPGDPTAPAAEIIACRCAIAIKIDWLQGLE